LLGSVAENYPDEQDQVDFVAGTVFDIRVEVQAPLNGSRPYNNGNPDSDFSVTIGRKKDGSDAKPLSQFYDVKEPDLTSYNFTYYEDLFYKQNNSATFVNVVSKDWRHVSLILSVSLCACFEFLIYKSTTDRSPYMIPVTTT
jgi:hypothetical protein